MENIVDELHRKLKRSRINELGDIVIEIIQLKNTEKDGKI